MFHGLVCVVIQLVNANSGVGFFAGVYAGITKTGSLHILKRVPEIFSNGFCYGFKSIDDIRMIGCDIMLLAYVRIEIE